MTDHIKTEMLSLWCTKLDVVAPAHFIEWKQNRPRAQSFIRHIVRTYRTSGTDPNAVACNNIALEGVNYQSRTNL